MRKYYFLSACLNLLNTIVYSQNNTHKTDSLFTVFTNPKHKAPKEIIQKDGEKKTVLEGIAKSNIGNMPIKQTNLSAVEKMPVGLADASIVYNMPIANSNAVLFDINKAPNVTFNTKDSAILFKNKKP
jgi:hypothetical protein